MKKNWEGRSTGKEEKGWLEIKWKIRRKYKGLEVNSRKITEREKKIKSRCVYKHTLTHTHTQNLLLIYFYCVFKVKMHHSLYVFYSC